MKDIDILISHFNSGKAIELCIESIQKFTKKPHNIIVLDDFSKEGYGLNYLRELHERGEIKLIESLSNVGHGKSLNRLINEECKAKYALILDNDVQILDYNWQEDFIEIATSSNKTLAVVDYTEKDIVPYGFRCGMYTFSFGLIDMKSYRNGMYVDWSLNNVRRDKEPFLTEFSDICTDKFKKEVHEKKWDAHGFNINRVVCDPGTALYIKAKYDNPSNYEVFELSNKLKAKHKHFKHVSIWHVHGEPTGKIREKVLEVEAALVELRK